MTITQETFDGLAFPIVRVRYAGPTETRGARWIATLRRDNERTYRATVSYDSGKPEGARNAIDAAWECWREARKDLVEPGKNYCLDYVAIPADLSADSYAFTFVPTYLFKD